MHEWKRWSRKYLRKSFDPDVSLIVVGLPPSEGEDLMAKVNNLLHVGLGGETVLCLAAVERVRVQVHGDQLVLVKVEMSSVQEKVTVLCRKSKLKDNDSFNKVYVSSAKLHAEPLMELNFRTLNRETGEGRTFIWQLMVAW